MAYIPAPVAPIRSCMMRLTVLEECRELIRPYYLRWVYFRLLPDALPRAFSQCWDSGEPHQPDFAAADPDKRELASGLAAEALEGVECERLQRRPREAAALACMAGPQRRAADRGIADDQRVDPVIDRRLDDLRRLAFALVRD